MYSNLPFTGAPFVYIALAIFFIAIGIATRLWSFINSKMPSNDNS